VRAGVVLGDILQVLAPWGGELVGGAAGARNMPITGLAALHRAGPGDLSFLHNPRYRGQLATSRAACVIVAPAWREVACARGACIVLADPYSGFARVTHWWKQQHPQRYSRPEPGIHASAVVHESAQIDASASVGPLCVVGPRTRIGAHSVLVARVALGENCRIGARCIIHPGAVIGADGFGFAPLGTPEEGNTWLKIEQLGGVQIGDDVEIGANTCVDRGALGDTVIERGAKLDNLIQIGHNVHIGAHTAMAGCTGVAGSTHIGAHCTIGGHASIIGHLHIADGVHIAAATTVSRSLTQSGAYAGVFPFQEKARWEKNAAALRQLSTLRERLKKLERQMEKMEQLRPPPNPEAPT